MPVSEANQRTGALRPTPLFSVEAQQLLAAGRLKQAIEVCKRGLVYFPEHIMGYVVLSQAYLAMGQQPRALNVLRDGHRRTGAEQLEVLRARMAGEIPLIDDVPSITPQPFEPSTPAPRTSEPPRPTESPAIREETPRPTEASMPEPFEPSTPAPRTITHSRSTEAPTTGHEEASTQTEESTSEPKMVPIDSVHPPADAPLTEEREVPSPSEETPNRPLPRAAEESTKTGDPQIGHADAEKAPVAPPAEIVAMVRPNAEQRVEPQREMSPDPERPSRKTSERKPKAPLRAEAKTKPEAGRTQAAKPATTEQPPASAHAPQPTPPAPKTEPEVGTTPSPAAPQPPRPASKPEPSSKGSSLRLISELERSDAPQSGSPANREQDDQQSDTGPRTIGMLALHKGSSVSRLRSSNLRLIPGLEFAPLRQEDNQRRQPIAPLINEPMPEPVIRARTKKPETRTPHSTLPPLEESVARERIVPPMVAPATSTPTPSPTDSAAPPIPETPVPEPEQASQRPTALPSFTKLANSYIPEKKGEELTPLEELARRLESARIPVLEEEEPARSSTYEPTIVSDTLANILVAQGAYAEALKAFQTLARTKPERLDYYEQRIAEMKERMQSGPKPRPGATDRSTEE